MDNFITKTTRSITTTTPQTTTTIMSCSYNIKNNRNDIKNLNNNDINSNTNQCKRNNKGNNTDNNNNMKNTNNNMKNNKNKCSCITLARLALLLLINASFASFASCSRDRSKPAHLEAKVGSHVAFNCHIDFPYDIPISYVVHWSKDKSIDGHDPYDTAMVARYMNQIGIYNNKKIYTWYEGEGSTNELFHGRLHMVGDHSDYGKASVNLTAIRESDQGWYHCQIIFPNRSPSIRNNGTWYHLTVQGGSLIKIPPVNQTIMEGQTAFFHCVMKFPEVSVVAWFKDGVPLKDMQELQRRSFMGPDGSLSIDPTMMSDLGEYECHVRNNQGDVQTAKGFLNIQYKAKVIYAPPEVFLPYGQPAVLDCHFRSNPPLKNLRWEKDGLLFDSYNVPGVFYKMNGSLFFSKVDENHAGSYTCTPYNDLGTDGPSPVISVIVLRPPIFSLTPKAIYIQKLGEVAELPCQAIDRDGNNRPNIIWSRKDGVPLPEGRHVNDHGNLTITQLSESDRGMYECSATNEAATITAETELMIENMVPRPPYNLSANSTETTIALRWQPGYLRPNLEYTVWYRAASKTPTPPCKHLSDGESVSHDASCCSCNLLTDMPEWRTMRVINKMEATLSNLLPGREYEFMVLSQDKHGDGMFSKQIRFSTLPAQPVDDLAAAAVETHHGLQPSSPPLAAVSRLSAPRNLTALPNAHGWLLHWQHPPEQGSDILRLYTVRWWEQPEHMLVGTAETLDNFYQMRHLKEEATFMVQVHAMSNEGEQVASDELLIEVPSHRKMRALAIGSVVGIIFLICALGTFIYVKRSCLRHLVGGGGGGRGGGGIGSAEHMKDTEKMSST